MPDAPFPVMEHMTVRMIREYLKTRHSIIIPIGVIEQHGYHLPLNTDALIAAELGRMIGERTGILVAPAMHQSFSGGSLPGTINISPAVMSLVLSDMLISLVTQGFRTIYLFPCHGGSENARALDNALRLLLRSNPAFRNTMIVMLPLWKLGEGTYSMRSAVADGDFHAGWFETSLMLALAPELVRMEELETDSEDLLRDMRRHPDNYQHAQKIVDDELVVPRLDQKADIAVGVMGEPGRASRETGNRIITEIVDAAVRKIMDLEKKADGVYKEVAFKPEPLLLG
jgi:creatinine amidohydrolase